MKRLALVSAAVLGLALSGCNNSSTTTAVTTVDNTLATLAKNSVPAACAIIGVAEGYFTTLQANIPAADVAAEQIAVTVVAPICKNPPTDLTAAFATLLQEWTIIQSATSATAK